MERNRKGIRWAGPAIAAGAVAVVLAGLVALSAQARGRDWAGREPSPDRIATRIAERVGLTADQRTKVQEILAQNIEARTAIRDEGRRKMESLRDDTEKRLAGVLSAEQMDKLRALREERRERRRDRCRDCPLQPEGRGGGFPGGPPPERN